MDWKIGKGGAGCASCGHGFEAGEEYFSILRNEGETLTRFDFCEPCFTGEPNRKGSVFWKTRKAESGPTRKQVNFEMLRDIFFKMKDLPDRPLKEITYFLGLILVRKRFLKLQDFLSRDGRDFMAVRAKAGAPLILVEIPLLSDADLSSLKDRLSLLLDADLDESLEPAELRKRLLSSSTPPQDPSLPS